MNITINGQPKQIEGPLTVAALLDALQLDGNRVAIELNRNVLRKEQFAAINLHTAAEGDHLATLRQHQRQNWNLHSSNQSVTKHLLRTRILDD